MTIDVVVPFFANAKRIRPTLDAILSQRIPEELQLNLIVVDDGTPDEGASAEHLRTLYPEARVLRLEKNGGRSQARNVGVAAGTGEYVMNLDSDCVLQGARVLAGHIARLKQCDVSIGSVVSDANGAWRELGNRTSVERSAAAQAGLMTLLTTAHVVMKRSAFETVGGYSAAYRHYGFEDRDLLSRLDTAGFKLTFTADLVAVERHRPNLPAYAHKARMAGKHTAVIFRRDHPELYAMTPYHRLDVGLHGWLRPAAVVARALLPGLIRIGDHAIGWTLLPLGLRVLIVRSLFATSFMVGTAEAARDS